MTLADLRRIAIKKNLQIRFGLSNGMECVVTEHGIATVPGLRSMPDFNLENELAKAERFTLESAGKRQQLGKDELSGLIASPTAAAAGHEDHED